MSYSNNDWVRLDDCIIRRSAILAVTRHKHMVTFMIAGGEDLSFEEVSMDAVWGALIAPSAVEDRDGRRFCRRWSLIAYALRERAQGEWVRWEDVRELVEAMAELGAASVAFSTNVRDTAAGRRYREALWEATATAVSMVTRAGAETGGEGQGHA